MNHIKRRLGRIFILLLLIVIGFGYIQNDLMPKTVEQSYSEFVQALDSGNVKEVTIDLTESNFVYVDVKGDRFKVSNPKTDDFKLILLEKDVDVIERASIGKTAWNIFSMLLSILPLMVIFYILSRTLNKTFGTKHSTKIGELPKTKLRDIAGMKEVKKDISILIEFLKNPKLFKDKGAKMPRGIILYGEPGTGKTLLAKAIAGEAGVPFYSMSGSDFVEMFVGLGAKRVRELFEKARASAPCIIFIDEIDAVGRKRGSDNNSEKDQTINALLAELDGFSSKDEVLVIAATNRLEDLDPALIRSGRFDKHVKVPLPMTKEERRAIIDIHKAGKEFGSDVDFNQLAKMTIGFSGADIANILNESVINSIMHGKEVVDNESIDNAFYQVILRGHRKESNPEDKSEMETKLVAYHEAGHALVARLLCKQSVPMVTIIGTTTGAGGFTISLPDNMGILTVEDLENKVIECYAGRAAEEIAGFARSTGASNDIEKATHIIKNMHTTYGMYNSLINTKILGIDMKDGSQLVCDINSTADRLYKTTLDFLYENKDKLDALATGLSERETLDEKELDTIL